MNKKSILLLMLLSVVLFALPTAAQTEISPAAEKRAEELFKKGNEAAREQKFADALKLYKEALTIFPDDPSILYNGGVAAFSTKEYTTTLDLWSKLKKIEPNDWMTRAKLVQTYQALNKIPERDKERTELFTLRKSNKVKELSEAVVYCREQFEAAGYKVMVLEHFELEGNRALRYAFMISKPDRSEEFKITLGSYDMTNAIWRETKTPTPKEGDRLFHIDGYYSWGHSTIGMYHPEPSYEETRAIVVKVLEGKQKPVSSSSVNKQ